MKFKRTFAVVLAAIMTFSMAACSSETDVSDDSASKKIAEISSLVEQVESENNKSNDDSSSDDEVIEPSFENGTFTHQFYTISADESKWKYVESSDVDCMFQYIGDSQEPLTASGSVSITSIVSIFGESISLEEYAEQMKQSLSAQEGFEAIETKVTSFNGYDAVQIELNYEDSDIISSITQILLISPEGAKVIISYGSEESVRDKLESEFEAVISTFKLS